MTLEISHFEKRYELLQSVMAPKDITALVEQLPPELQQEVYDFAQFLLKTRGGRKKSHLSLNWAGGLKEFRDDYSSLELQEKAQEWWSD
jgi:hypothetical protein